MNEPELNKTKKSRIVIEFNNPRAAEIIRTCALLERGMTIKGLISRLLKTFLLEECRKTPLEVEEILGYKLKGEK